ncbi:MAG: hypothetical protein NZX77_06465 [Polyangiaceae bacterium]|nr:hypothetical protein [Polyangiaceae bacterium]
MQSRLASSRAELLRITEALARRPHPEERAILTGTLLGTIGYLLRRPCLLTSTDLPPTDLDRILADLPREDLQAWLASASVTELRRTLQRAADAAFESTLAEEETEQESLREIALEGLAKRERLASIFHALDRWQQLHGPLDERARRRYDALALEASRIDDSLRASSVALTPLNDERRAERDVLQETFRASSWWYTRHADRDDLAALPLGASPSLFPLSPRTSAVLQILKAPPSRHLSSDELWASELGTLEEHQRAWIQRHTASCASCHRALQALNEGEEAIREALRQLRQGATPRDQEAPRRRSWGVVTSGSIPKDQEVLFDHPRFRVLACPIAENSRILIEEKQPRAVATVHPVGGLKPRKVRQGFELTLPSHGKEIPRLRLVLASGEEIVAPLVPT